MGASIKPVIREFLEATGAINVVILLLEKIPESLGIIGLIVMIIGCPVWMIYRISKHKIPIKHDIHLNSYNKLLANFLWSGYWVFPLLPFAIRGLFLLNQNTTFNIIGIIYIPLVIVLSWWMAIVENK